MREIADQAGVSAMTVSRALRNDPKISAATRSNITRLCQELGYQPDPRLSELMTHLRRSRAKRANETIALIHILPEVETGAPLLSEKRQIAGFKRRAKELGFAVDAFDWLPSKLSTKAMIRILQARGIRGVAILTRGQPSEDIHALHERFAIATLDGIDEGLHHGHPDHFDGMSIVVEKLREKGYRRPAFFMLDRVANWTSERWQAAFMYRVDRHFAFDSRSIKVARQLEPANLLAWLDDYAPDVVVSHIPIVEVRQCLLNAGYRIPDDIGIASVEWMPNYPEIAGLDQQSENTGVAATDIIARQIAYNEAGPPAFPKKVLVQGVWRDGPSLK